MYICKNESMGGSRWLEAAVAAAGVSGCEWGVVAEKWTLLQVHLLSKLSPWLRQRKGVAETSTNLFSGIKFGLGGGGGGKENGGGQNGQRGSFVFFLVA